MNKNKVVVILGALIGAFFGCLGWWVAWKLLTSYIGVAAAIGTCIIAAICAAIGAACVSFEEVGAGERQYTFNGPIARLIRRVVFWWLDCCIKFIDMFKRERPKADLPNLHGVDGQSETGGEPAQQKPADETK